MTDARYRGPEEVPDCPACGRHLFVDSSVKQAVAWVCYNCDHEFDARVEVGRR